MDAVSLEQKAKKSIWKRLIATTANLAILVLMALFIVLFLAHPMRMKGHSMEPAVSADSTVLVNRLHYSFLPPAQFDVVACSIGDSRDLQIKRIVAVPGDRIRIEDGDIIINGRICEEANQYIHDLTAPGQAASELVLGEDEYFVLGDHAAYSEDSRFRDVGLIRLEQIAGRAWFTAESFLSFRLIN